MRLLCDYMAASEALKPYVFTPEKAREAAFKSHQPGSARFVHPIDPSTESQQAEDFRRERLSIARAEVVRLDKLVSAETDPKRLRDLYAALDSASERERRLSNRSLPPTIRAGSNKQRRQATGQASFHEPEILPDPAPNPPSDTPIGSGQ